MRKLLSLSLFLVFSANVWAQSKDTGTFQFVERMGHHTAKLIVKSRVFARSRHNITFADEQYLRRNQVSLAQGVSLVTKVDGREPLGVDGTVPRIEIESMVVFFDGRKIAIPQRFYSDCYNPNLGKNYFATKLNGEGDSLLVFMAGSDGAGGYEVMWVLRKDGHHSRFINNCSDCDYQGLLDFFIKQ